MSRFRVHHRFPFLRRLYEQRDQARSERDRAIADRGYRVAERDAAITERDHCRTQRDAAIAERDHLRSIFIEVANAELPATPFGRTSEPSAVEDSQLVARIIAAYRASIAIPAEASESFWDGVFAEQRRDVREALVNGDSEAVQRLLRDPGKTDLFYGFEELARSLDTSKVGPGFGIKIYQDLLLLAEAIGVRRTWNPESPKSISTLPQVDDLLALIDRGLGLSTVFPNPFPGEIGLATSRGVITQRAVQALFQAWRVFGLANGDREARVVEIGAGLGRTAFYARQFGLRNYTIVDLPMTSVAQGYFLGRALNPDTVCLFGEQRPGIRILPPFAFFEAKDRYDLALNVDSLTELDPKTAKAYCEAIGNRAAVWLSINHEVNAFTAREMGSAAGMVAMSRAPYWPRAGYVEEVFRNP